MNRPVMFDLPADNPESLALFYQQVFGWEIAKHRTIENYWILRTGSFEEGGLNGGIMGRFMPGPVNTIEVQDVDAILSRVPELGGTITTPKLTEPRMGASAWCKDPDGHYFVVTERDPDFLNEMKTYFPRETKAGQWQNRPVHFEIPSRDLDKLSAFYAALFSWDIVKWDGPYAYRLVTTGDANEPGINGAIMAMEHRENLVNTIAVEDMEDYLQRIREAGGSVSTEVMSIPNIGQFAYCQDPDRNTFGLLQPIMR